MNNKEVFQFYKHYIHFYNNTSFEEFSEIYTEELGDIPLYLMKAALKKWRTKAKGAFPPSVYELKEILWRIKLIAQSKLFDSNYNEEWNAIHYGTSKYSPADLISETEDEKWVKYDKARPVLSAEEKSQLATIVAELNRGLRGFNSQYE